MATEYTPEQLEAIKKSKADINALTEVEKKLLEEIGELNKNSKISLEDQIKDLELMANLYKDESKQYK